MLLTRNILFHNAIYCLKYKISLRFSKEHIKILMFLQIYIGQQKCLEPENAHFHTLECQHAEVVILHCCHSLLSSHDYFTCNPQSQSFFAIPDQKIPKHNLAILSKHFLTLISNSYVNFQFILIHKLRKQTMHAPCKKMQLSNLREVPICAGINAGFMPGDHR